MAQSPAQYEGTTEFSCNDFFICLTDEELRGLAGKKLEYRHPQPRFGIVSITLKSSDEAELKNDTMSGSGSWRAHEGKLEVTSSSSFGSFRLRFFRIGRHLFVHLGRDGPPILMPVKVSG